MRHAPPALRFFQVVALAATVSIAGVSRPAGAAVLDVTAGTLTYTAGAGVANVLIVSLVGSTYTIDDVPEAAVTPTAGALTAGCLSVDANTVTCPAAAVSAFAIDVVDQADTVNLATVTVPASVTGGTGNDALTGGQAGDTFIWNPGGGNDSVDGGPGVDTELFNSANVNENVAVTAIPSGFHLTRDVAAIAMDVVNVEGLDMVLLGGTDNLSTVRLASTLQVLDGGAQTDTLTFNALGQCVVVGPGSITVGGVESATYNGFEQVTVVGNCQPIFSDGFEAGTLAAWSASFP